MGNASASPGRVVLKENDMAQGSLTKDSQIKASQSEDTLAVVVLRRRIRLRRLIDQRHLGRITDFAKAIGKTQPLISNLLSDPPRETFGEKLARSIERLSHMPDGWLDMEEPANEYPELSADSELFLIFARAALKHKNVPQDLLDDILKRLHACPNNPTA